MADSSRKTVCIIIIGLLATAISCEAANAGQHHRKMLQWGRSRDRLSNLGPNTLRAQASTSQAITEAVNNGGSLAATRRAGYVGASGSWAVTQGNQIFNVVDWQNTYRGLKRKQ